MAFCKNFANKIKFIWQKIDSELLSNAKLALQITTTLKKWLGSDVAIVLTDLFPGDTDNIIRKKLLDILSISSTTLGLIVAQQNQPLPTAYIDVHNILEALGKKQPSERNAILIKLASLVTSSLDKRFDTHIYDTAVQIIYSLEKNNK